MAKQGKTWSTEQRRKFKRTMAAKHANKKTTSIPLESIPDKPVRRLRAAKPTANHQTLRLELAIELVKLVRGLLQ